MTDLIPEWRVGSLVLTDSPFAIMADDSVDYGNPENITELIRSMFLDGDYEVSSKTGNRSVSLPVLIEDADLAVLSDAEALLEAECKKQRNEVYCDPGDGFAAPFLFDVFRGQLAFARTDKFERNGFRSYTLTFRALPHSRSAEVVADTPTPTTVGTARQKSYSFDVGGSARTEASLHVAGAVGGLGTALIYTRPGAAGMIPLRQHRTGGGAVTADASLVSGSYDQDISTAFAAAAPKADVPDGTYILLGRVRAASGSGATTLTTTISTEVDGYAIRPPVSTDVEVDLSTSWEILNLGPAFQLPSAVVASEAGATIVVEVVDAASGLTVRLDDAWLVEIGTGALSMSWAGSFSPVGMPAAAHIWVDAPSATYPGGRVLRGAASDQSDAFSMELAAWSDHVLEPGVNTAFLVTDADTTSVLDLSWWPRWHTHAGS